MLFRSKEWKARQKRAFVAREAGASDAQVAIVLTNGGSLRFYSRARAFEYAVGWMQCPFKVMAQAWWLLDVTELQPSASRGWRSRLRLPSKSLAD